MNDGRASVVGPTRSPAAASHGPTSLASDAAKIALAFMVSLCAAAALSACGNSGRSHAEHADVVARVGTSVITRTSLDHWAPIVFNRDFSEITRTAGPTGVISDPQHLATCVSALERFEGVTGHLPANEAQRLADKCTALNKAVEAQALNLLITTKVTAGEAADAGIVVSTTEAEAAFKRVQASQFPTEAQLRQHLAGTGATIDDELVLTGQELGSQKLKTALEAKFNGAQKDSKLASYATAAVARWTAKTTCAPGYVVEGCREYGKQPSMARGVSSPSILIEELLAARKKPAAAGN